MQILRADAYRSMPWKNGGGVTTEIAVFPPGAGLDDFVWRISMARVESSGPFSLFPGIDRSLAILEGEGIFLNVEGQIPIGLTDRSEPLPFPADVPTSAALIGGPITDLNVMTRRGRVNHSVERLTIDAPLDVEAQAPTLVFCRDGSIEIDTGRHIGRHDTLGLGLHDGHTRLVPLMPSTIFIVRIHGAESER